jgi:hypothetical protein
MSVHKKYFDIKERNTKSTGKHLILRENHNLEGEYVTLRLIEKNSCSSHDLDIRFIIGDLSSVTESLNNKTQVGMNDNFDI